MGKYTTYIGVSVIMLIFFMMGFAITGYASYSKTTIENNTADGEGLFYPNGTWGKWFDANRYDATKTNNTTTEIIDIENGKLIWDYVFNTSYNETGIAKMTLLGNLRSFSEDIDIKIYNYSNNDWVLMYQLTEGVSYQQIQVNISRQDYNLSNFVNDSGKMQLAFWDDSRALGALYIRYLAINVTVSPFYSKWFNFTNSSKSWINQSDANQYVGLFNKTRNDTLNVSSHWNVSYETALAEYGYVIDAALVLNKSQELGQVSVNLTSSGFSNYTGNWTNYTLDFSNVTLFPVAGNYTMRLKGWDAYWQQNFTSTWAKAGFWSNANISSAFTNETNNRVLGGKNVTLLCRVLDSNSSYPVSGYPVDFYNESSLLGTVNTNSTGWATFDYSESNTSTANRSIMCNISNQSSLYYDTPGNSTVNLTLSVIEDPYPPVINSVVFYFRNMTINRTNLYSNISIIVNVSDNITSVDTANASIYYPDGIIVPASLNQNQTFSDLWFVVFNETDQTLPVNETGVYGINITAYDQNGNMAYYDWNNGANANFTAYSRYNVTLEYHTNSSSSYNRGEGLALYARDVNGLVMYNVNWTVNMTKFNQSESNLSDVNGSNNYTFFSNSTDPVGNWTLEVINVTDSLGVNWDNETFQFNISSTLTPYFIYPAANAVFSPGVDVNDGEIRVRVNHSRGATANYSLNMTLSCPTEGNRSLPKSVSSPTFSNSSSEFSCTAPASYSTAFTLVANVSDEYNNTGTGFVSLSTSGEPGTGGTTGGTTGTTGSPGGGPVCECTDWVDAGCGVGICGIDKMYQTRVCTPSGCSNESQCIEKPTCELFRDFEIFADRSDFAMESGEDRTVTLTFDNTGNASMDIDIAIERDCCNVSFMHKTIELKEQSSVDVPIVIHSSLIHEPGDYVINVKANWSKLEKTKVIHVAVTKNRMIGMLQVLRTELETLENQISVFGNSGVYAGGLEELASDIKEYLDQAEKSIGEDDIEILNLKISNAQDGITEVQGHLTNLGFQKVLLDNKWWILLAAIVIFFSTYLIIEVLLPLHKLNSEINQMKQKEREMVQQRREIEKQYFMGKLNEKAFNDMIIGEQQKILGVRGAAIEKAKIRNHFVKKKLTPKSIVKWVHGGLKKIKPKIKKRKHIKKKG